MSTLRKFYLNLLKIRLPYSSKRFVGEDLKGNFYFEEVRENYPRRTVKLLDQSIGSDLASLSSAQLPVQWVSWMRHTRHNPPTLEELMNDEVRRQKVAENVKKLDLEYQQEKQKLLNEGKISAQVEPKEEPKTESQLPPKPTKPATDEFQPESWSPVAREK